MLPVTDLQVCDAKSLAPGEFAYLADIGGGPVLVGEGADATPLALFLSDDPQSQNFSEAQSLYGVALKVPSFVLEVELRVLGRWDRSKETAQAILATGGKLHFVATGPRGLFPVALNMKFEVTGEGVSAVFPHWRIVKQVGMERHTLFERAAPQ